MNRHSHPTLPGFGWVLPDALAGMALPNPDSWSELVLEGIGAVVTLTGAVPPGAQAAGLRTLHHPVLDFGIPDADALDTTLAWMHAEVQDGRAVVVHCRAGLGRTGTVLAAYLGRFTDLSADEAIQRVRALRPRSIETRDQQAFVRAYLAMHR